MKEDGGAAYPVFDRHYGDDRGKEQGGKSMKFLTDNELFAFNVDLITAAFIKKNKNEGPFRNNREYPFVASVHVCGREKPFTVFLTEKRKAELFRLMGDAKGGAM